MPQTIYLFPDTNLFFQCKSLAQLDWARFGADSIELIVTRPMLAEIDSHKSKGNSRTAKRARTASSGIGQALNAESGFLVVKEGPVNVRLHVKVMLKEDKELDDQLSYSERDHQLVGIASKFSKQNSELDVRVLTHDYGVQGAASGVGIKFERIPEEWLLGPEPDEREKQIQALQQDLKKYQNAEPKIEIDLGASVGSDAKIEVELPIYLPLTDDEVARLIVRVKAVMPAETDFGSKEEKEVTSTGLQSFMMATKVFKPSTDEEVENYCEVLYPKWLAKCENYFRSLNDKMMEKRMWPVVRVKLRNVGSRPANDALVSFATEGKFLLAVPADKDDVVGSDAIRLPPPPSAPKGRWVDKPHPFADMQTIFGQARGLQFSDIDPPSSRLLMSNFTKDDPNGFYYDGGRPKNPVPRIGLTCRQWRHQVDDEVFILEFRWWADGEATVQGALRVDVHAANMTELVSKRFPICLRSREESIFEDADALIDMLAIRPRLGKI